MPVQAIENYLQKELSPKLTEFGVSEKYMEYLCGVVETQMLSALLHWEDISFRKALLLIALEEGSFYKPSGIKDIKCFVVLTLRNSPFESLQSENYCECGLSKPLSDTQIKTVTSAAIRYFNGMDFGRLSYEVQNEPNVFDIYGQLAERCPVTWKALVNLASSPAKTVVYTRAEIEKPFYLKGAGGSVHKGATMCEAIFDGYSAEIDPGLAQQLAQVTQDEGGNGCLIVDCFKMLTRNIEKLLSVMEFLLTRDCAFVTTNYYIENGYVERRMNVLRAASCKNALADMQQHFSMTKGLGQKHKRVLEMSCGRSEE